MIAIQERELFCLFCKKVGHRQRDCFKKERKNSELGQLISALRSIRGNSNRFCETRDKNRNSHSNRLNYDRSHVHNHSNNSNGRNPNHNYYLNSFPPDRIGNHSNTNFQNEKTSIYPQFPIRRPFGKLRGVDHSGQNDSPSLKNLPENINYLRNNDQNLEDSPKCSMHVNKNTPLFSTCEIYSTNKPNSINIFDKQEKNEEKII